jgi:hypothetical protein
MQASTMEMLAASLSGANLQINKIGVVCGRIINQ